MKGESTGMGQVRRTMKLLGGLLALMAFIGALPLRAEEPQVMPPLEFYSALGSAIPYADGGLNRYDLRAGPAIGVGANIWPLRWIYGGTELQWQLHGVHLNGSRIGTANTLAVTLHAGLCYRFENTPVSTRLFTGVGFNINFMPDAMRDRVTVSDHHPVIPFTGKLGAAVDYELDQSRSVFADVVWQATSVDKNPWGIGGPADWHYIFVTVMPRIGFSYRF